MVKDSLMNSAVRKRNWLNDDDLKSQEKEFLQLVSQGDLLKLRSLLDKYGPEINMDCSDIKGYRALDIAVTLHDEDFVNELLSICDFSVAHIQGALLRAVEMHNVRLVQIFIEKCQPNEPKYFCYSNQQCVDMTPIMLAAINEDFEILGFLLRKNHYIIKPHVPKCLINTTRTKTDCRTKKGFFFHGGCLECFSEKNKPSETLQQSIARINAYRALASPTYIVLSSADPILTAFKLSSEASSLANDIPEHREIYKQLSVQCSQFSADFLQQCRTTEEVETLLSQKKGLKDIRYHRYSRIWLAVHYKQKQFVAHPHCQQVLYATWLGDLAGWKTYTQGRKAVHVLTQIVLTPLLCTLQVLLPRAKIIKPLRVPFNRFIHHVTSYSVFLLLLLSILFAPDNQDIRELAVAPRLAADVWIVGNVLEVIVKIWSMGFSGYMRSWWGRYDFLMHFCFLISEAICFGVYLYSFCKSGDIMWNRMELPWWHPVLTGEGVFACASVLAFCRILLWYQTRSMLGPLGISLTEMANDVARFFTIFFVLMCSFAVGINSIYRHYDGAVRIDKNGDIKEQPDAFISLRKTFKTLFWATFGLGEPDYADIVVNGNFTNSKVIKHGFTEDIGYFLWGIYHLLTVVVMLNMLIAMMAQSYERIQRNADTEWKFGRSTLWLSYFDNDTVVPSPLNLVPSLRRIVILSKWTYRKLARKATSSTDIYFRGKCCNFDEVDHISIKENEDKYQKLLKQLRRRYLDWRNHRIRTGIYLDPYERTEKIKQEVIQRFQERCSHRRDSIEPFDSISPERLG